MANQPAVGTTGVAAQPDREAAIRMPNADWWRLALVVPALVAVDQITKAMAERLLDARRPTAVIPGVLDLWPSTNPGAVFGLTGSLDPSIARILLIVLAAVALALLLRLYGRLSRQPSGAGGLMAGLLLVLSGTVGNLVDRLLRGEVVDFLHFGLFGPAMGATCNVADLFIAGGLLWMVASTFRRRTPRGGGTPQEAPRHT